ncbi:MAG: beta-lactamase family protein [Oculatellaceae cyanobacterium Prado106]|nr:beta-lactamase family protein [Oculatellaceae cyanobacterium Prado106]
MKLKAWAIATLIPILSCAGCRWGTSVESLESPFALRRQTQAIALQTRVKQGVFPEKISIKLRQILYQHAFDDRLPGVVLYIATSDGVWSGAAGTANVEAKQAMQPTDRFRIASLTKMFVSVVCLQLAEEGRLSLNDTMAQWLPQEVSDRFPDSQKTTIRQLLNHTTGFNDPYTDAFQQAVLANPTYKWQAQEVLEFAEGRDPATVNGSFYYSNTNYLLLELILEQVTGEPLAQTIRQRILTPLDLSDTFMEVREPIPDGFAQGYQDWDKTGKPKNMTKPLVNDGLGLGDGGLVSSAPDLARFMRVLFGDNGLIQPESRNEMLNLVGRDRRGGYGMGISYQPTAWGEAWGHTGKTTGFMSDIMYLPAHDMIIVAWTNSGDSDRGNPSEIIEDSLRVIFGKTSY